VPIELAALALAALLLLYAIFVLTLLALGRPSDARALAGFVPDCIVLFRRLLSDDRLSRSRKLALAALIAYLALPVDLVPDFIPVLGVLDDAILVALALRFVVRGASPELIDRYWPGPPKGAQVIRRLAFGSSRP
jgi:uncharacterized membrane protein YkvA (DUF1232 family)